MLARQHQWQMWALLGALLLLTSRALGEETPLASWADGAAKKSILEFVRATTQEGSAEFVPAAERIVVFDQDGTLWVEQPIYTQVTFAIDRVKALAPQYPEWKTKQPFQALLAGDQAAISGFTIQDFEQVVATTHSGMTVEEFHGLVKEWLATARHPRFKRPYTELVYQPMLEVIQHYRDHGYKTYIVTGGGQEFVRVYAQQVYGIPPEQVIGSAGKVRYAFDPPGAPRLLKLPEVLLIDDRGGKPEGINFVIGRRPVAAFGNSTGDQQMLEWTGGGAGVRQLMLVHHDDAAREYAYGAESKIGTFSAALGEEARKRGWTVISMKNDWKRIFAFDP